MYVNILLAYCLSIYLSIYLPTYLSVYLKFVLASYASSNSVYHPLLLPM